MRSDYLAGVAVVVREDDQPLREYETDTTQDLYKTTTAYIESVPGAEFTVDVVFDNTYPYHQDDLAAWISLDGIKVDGKIGHQNDHRTITFTGAIRGSREKPVIQRFTFAALQTTDGQPKASLKDKLAKLGEIDVKLYRCRLGAQTEYDFNGYNRENVAAGGVPEKALKGRSVSTHATLGKSVPHGVPRQVHVHWDFGKVPIAVYTFKYRTRRDLQIEGIIERSASPVPLEDRAVEDLSPEEMRELLRRQRVREQIGGVKREGQGVKRERSATVISDGYSDAEDDDVEVVSEAARHKRARAGSAIEVIDLSGI